MFAGRRCNAPTPGLRGMMTDGTRLPTWWLMAIAFYSATTSISIVFDLIIFPDRIEQLVGDERKHATLGALTSLRGVVHLSLPLVGTAVDHCHIPCGRRRPFLAIGCMFLVVGLWLCKDALRIESFAAGYVVYAIGCMVCYVPYTAVIPDLIPPAQRASASAWQFVMGSGGSYVGLGLGMWVGEGKMSSNTAMVIAIAACAASIPFGLLSLSARPGLCVGEKPVAEQKQEGESSRIHAAAWHPTNVIATVVDTFKTLFRSRSYRYQWICTFVGSFDVSGFYLLYWLQDSYTEFTVFGVHMGSTPQTALAIVTAAQKAIGVIVAVPGGYIGDHFFGPEANKWPRRNLLLVMKLVGLSGPIVYIMRPSFTLLVCYIMATTILQGLTQPISGAFSADCLPLAADGKPASAARESAIMMYAAFLPMSWLPALSGEIFNNMQRTTAYETVYIWAALVGLGALALFCKIPSNGCLDEPRLAQEAALAEAIQRRRGKRQPPPVGARLCDRLCFGAAAVAAAVGGNGTDGEEYDDSKGCMGNGLINHTTGSTAIAAAGTTPRRQRERSAQSQSVAEEEEGAPVSPRSPRSSDDTKESIAEWRQRRRAAAAQPQSSGRG